MTLNLRTILLLVAIGFFVIALCLFQGWLFDGGNAWAWLTAGLIGFTAAHLP